jgi:ribose transport system permease protein
MNVKSVGIIGLFLLLAVFMAVMTSQPWYDILHGTFLQPNNVENLLRRTSMYGLLGIGVAFVIITSGIDLSVGSIVCLSGCLLAIFLKVDYRSADQADVIQLRAAEQTILVRSPEAPFAIGDRVRLSGGRRVKNAMLQIKEQSRVDLEDSRGRAAGHAWLLSVEGELNRDDDSGTLARLYAIEDFREATGEMPAEIVIAGEGLTLKARDQVTLVHPAAGQKQSEIIQAQREGARLRLSLKRPLGTDFQGDWSVIPLQRRQRMPVAAAVLGVLAVAAILGTIHGLLVTRGRLQPFVVTLCGLLIYRGASRWLVNDQPVGFGNEYADQLSWLGSGKWKLWEWSVDGRLESFGLPYPLFILAIVALIAGLFLNKTIWGRYLLALGNNEEAARFSGIRTAAITQLAYLICTMLAALAGMLFALDSNSVSPSSFGNFFELYAIAAAVLGGCSLRGGEGTILGVVVGTAVMQVLNNLILLMKISDELEFAIIGLVILLGVTGDEVVRRWSARRKAAT